MTCKNYRTPKQESGLKYEAGFYNFTLLSYHGDSHLTSLVMIAR